MHSKETADANYIVLSVIQLGLSPLSTTHRKACYYTTDAVYINKLCIHSFRRVELVNDFLVFEECELYFQQSARISHVYTPWSFCCSNFIKLIQVHSG